MHKSVLLQETIELANLSQGESVIDLTVGAGGHSAAILDLIGESGKLLCVDTDKSALALAERKLEGHKNVTLVQGNFREIDKIAKKFGIKGAKFIVADLGVSSMQIDDKHRGFSFSGHNRLDMRMNQNQAKTAADIVNNYTEGELTRIFKLYGEERLAKPIAREIVRERVKNQIVFTNQLAEVVRRVYRKNFKFQISNFKLKRDPATQTFQAIRIEVNEELESLQSALPQMTKLLTKGGRLAIISFHSLEDRIVKDFMKSRSQKCTCPPEFPKCICSTKPELRIITKKSIVPTQDEIILNPRSRSAKLRVAEKII